jgi:acyl transferase domain-containing protein
VSFALGLQGPCASYDTACSASLVASHGSVRALQRAECDAALSAGVNMILDPATMRGNAVAGFTSVRGRSHTFDARADGYARGEATDAIACKLDRGSAAPLAADLVGSAIRQDGRSASLTAPNGQAQRGVFGSALADAGQGADETTVLEAHGTGTTLGDPIEASSVAAVFLAHRDGWRASLAVGSLKANAGHAEPGAGLAGALRLLSQLQDSSATPNAQLRSLSPHVDGALRGTACALPVQQQLRAEEAHSGDVSSFGYSGTIAHAVLRQPSHAAVGIPPSLALTYKRHVFAWCDPSHPFAQFHSHSTQSATIFRSPAGGALHAVVAGHVVRGRVIFPGAGYLEIARAAAPKRSALRGVFFLQPLAVEAAGLIVECAVTDDRFEVRSGEDDALAGSAAAHCSGALGVSDGWERRVAHASVRGRSCAHAAHVGALYDGFDALGLQYGPGYRTLVHAWGGACEALARLRARVTREATAVHPAHLDDALCACALASRGEGYSETRLPFAVDEARIHGLAGVLWAVRRPPSSQLSTRSSSLTFSCVRACVCRSLRRSESPRLSRCA